ncbi:hypothetical protein M23134_01522 [Microscilla marina ATCC 23134]|uniref:Uncharacterized protein n=1 Tax=Microscilla marina ATCC 23134 TaxID=313606 RepID=A1ZK09_MICM2|nr:hypothetical protein M23134_01522 [Microscilla marina ATCC 23134]
MKLLNEKEPIEVIKTETMFMAQPLTDEQFEQGISENAHFEYTTYAVPKR